MALDTKNWDEFQYILTEDVSWDYSDEFGAAFRGIDQVVSGIRTSIEPHPASMHAPLDDPGLVHGTRYRLAKLLARPVQVGP